MSVDPLALTSPLDQPAYVYVENNPFGLVDPDGHDKVSSRAGEDYGISQIPPGGVDEENPPDQTDPIVRSTESVNKPGTPLVVKGVRALDKGLQILNKGAEAVLNYIPFAGNTWTFITGFQHKGVGQGEPEFDFSRESMKRRADALVALGTEAMAAVLINAAVRKLGATAGKTAGKAVKKGKRHYKKPEVNTLKQSPTSKPGARKFQGVDKEGPIRVRLDKPHLNDPGYKGPKDPLHTKEHIHIERRAKGATGPWITKKKAEFLYPFKE